MSLLHTLHMDKNCDRDIMLYGYLRGCDIKKGTKVQVHIAGISDFPLAGVTSLAEPHPSPHIDSTDLKVPTADVLVYFLLEIHNSSYLLDYRKVILYSHIFTSNAD